jgi:AcrR family transcriptional regulator
MQTSPGLRERKRQRTRETIARAALAIFDRQGFHETTIPQIAEAADVSPRTVSAYFPHKEDLAFPDADAELASLEARMRERQPGETATAALHGWIRAWLEDDPEHAAERRTRRRVIRADDALRAYEHHHARRAQALIAAAIAQDLGLSADALEPRMAAAATLTVFDLLGEDYDTADPADALAVVARALQFIEGGIGALRPDAAARAR